MLDRAVESLENDPKLSSIVGVIAESGEAKWTIEQAKEEKVDAFGNPWGGEKSQG